MTTDEVIARLRSAIEAAQKDEGLVWISLADAMHLLNWYELTRDSGLDGEFD